jgi:hypothetical protein
MRLPDWIGWLATAVFLASYSCKDQQKLRLTQAAAALLWVGYGVLLHAVPIIVANLLVAGVAAYSSLSRRLQSTRATSQAASAALRIRAAEPDLSGTS